jgi:hypothetical protein
MRTLIYLDDEALSDALEKLNASGLSPELAAVDSAGTPFVASMADEGDSVTLTYVYTDPDGWPTGRHTCDECAASGPTEWRPRWPVTVLAPDGVRGVL